MNSQILYIGRDLVAYQYIEDPAPDMIVVTLDYWRAAEERVHPDPFCRRFFHSQGVSQVHIFATWNHWYHCDDLAKISDVINRTFPETSIVIVGGSMGGYGAFLLSSLIKTAILLAFSPQVEVPASFDGRFGGWDGIPHRESFYETASLPDRTYVLYDPYVAHDRRHVEILREHCKMIELKFPFYGHCVDRALHQTGQFDGLVKEIMEGSLSSSRLSYWRRKNRLASPDYRGQLMLQRESSRKE